MTTKQILIEAAHLIQKHGHAKGRLEALDGSMCVMGAVEKALTVHTGNCTGAGFLLREDLSSYIGQPIVKFNDHPSTTPEEVIQVLLEAAHATR